jgi:RimJ/RimL family protein N-acetyltransferase
MTFVPPADFTLRTKRLLLRAVAPDDAEALATLCGDIEIARNTATVPHPYTRAHAEAFAAKAAADFAAGARFVFIALMDGRIVANTGLDPCTDKNDAWDMGYWTAAQWRGQGVASEAGKAVARFAFDTLGAARLVASHFADNPASGAVLRSIGFAPTGGSAMRLSVGRGESALTIGYELTRAAYEAASVS